MPDEVGDDTNVVVAAVQEFDERACVQDAQRHRRQAESEPEEHHEPVLAAEFGAQADPNWYRGDDDFLNEVDDLKGDDTIFESDDFARRVRSSIEEFLRVARSGDDCGRDKRENADDINASLNCPPLCPHVDRNHAFDKE